MSYRLMMAGLLVFGSWQLGQSAYLYAKAELAQFLLEQAWQEMQQGKSSQQPWPWADTSPLVKMDIPSIRQHFIVLAGASGRNLAFGPAHMSGSAAPGDVGVSVIGGHRDTHFKMLQQMMLGDTLNIEHSDGRISEFKVTNIQITDVRESRIRLDADVPTVALVACYPFDAVDAGGPLRYLVIAEQVETAQIDTESIHSDTLDSETQSLALWMSPGIML